MKILFVYPNQTHQEHISLGISYMSSYIRQFGHTAEVMDYTWGGSVQDCIDKIEEGRPDVVGFSLTSGDLPFSLDVARAIKRVDKQLPIIFGGAHATVVPGTSILHDGVDMVCVGEGEYAVRELLDRMENEQDYFSVPNFVFKRNGEIVRNPVAPLELNLDLFPFPDRDIWDMERYIEASYGTIDMIAGRGCPYKCSYCINHRLHQIYSDNERRVRFRSPGNILAETDHILKSYPGQVKHLFFQDDIFALSKSWVADFAAKYLQAGDLSFGCNGRVEALDEEMCEYLAQAGCTSLHIGIESGSERLRKSVLRRNMTNAQIVRAFGAAKKWGMKANSFNMVGLPYETEADIWETIRLNRECEPDYLQVFIFQPYPGTELHTLCKEKGWLLTETMPVSFKLTSIMNYPHMSAGEIVWHKKMFRFRVMRHISLRKALPLLLLDVNYELFLKFRAWLPTIVRRGLYKVLRSFSGGAANTNDIISTKEGSDG